MSRPKIKHKFATEKASQGKPLHKEDWSFHGHVLKLLIALFLIVAIVAVFWQVRTHEFLKYDDQVYVTDNPAVKAGLTLKGVVWAFTTMHGANWHPLTWLSHMLDCQLYGLKPGGHHLTSLVFHIASTLLLFLVLRQMTGALWRSGFVAALFAFHPLHVESVAWAAERKDVLSTFFWMLTMWAYVRYVKRPGLNRYLLVLLWFVLGLLSKPMLVTLPFVLLLVDYWPLGRVQFGEWSGHHRSNTHKSKDTGDQRSIALRLVLEKAPFFVLAGVSSFLTFLAQQKAGAVASSEIRPFSMRIANALVSYVSYIGKMIWPHRLAVFYPYPEVLPLWQVAGAALLLGCVSFLVILAARRRAYLMVGWLWYLGTLVPVIGLVQVGEQAMADRYTYVPLIGLFIIIAMGVPDILSGWRHRRIVMAIPAGLLLSILMIVTWLQLRYWQNGVTLFEHSLEVTANNSLIQNGLGALLVQQGKDQEAMSHFAEALRINPNSVEAHYNLGVVLSDQGKTQEAMTHFTEALRINPNSVEAHYNLGVTLAQQGKTQEAIAHFTKALQIKPDYADAHNNLGLALADQGKTQEAAGHYTEALRIDPNNAYAHNNLGLILAQQGKNQEAIIHYTEALRIKPDYAEVHNNLGVALAQQGKNQEAIGHFTQALRIKPDYAEAHNNLGIALAQQGRNQEAIGHFAQALRIKPDYAEPRFSLGLAYLMMGNRSLALEEYEILKTINPSLANTLYHRIFK
jgi:tetratricopeptide (TPR) repeat protein